MLQDWVDLVVSELQSAWELREMGNLPDLTLEHHRIYLLRSFEQQANGDIVCSAFARIRPDHIVSVRFPNAVILASWQDPSSKLSWPFEIVSLRAVNLGRKRFRFTLDCIDLHQQWESDWPELLS
jgi:hypothetical protein